MFCEKAFAKVSGPDREMNMTMEFYSATPYAILELPDSCQAPAQLSVGEHCRMRDDRGRLKPC